MLIFENKITTNHDAFIQKVNDISAKLDINPNWLMAVMNSETGGTFSPSSRNSASGAVGLIQILPSTAIDLGTTVEQLRNMSNVQQLDYVYKYFYPYRNYINKFEDLYIITFYPNADGKFASTLSKPDSWEFPLVVQNQNPGIDTIADFKQFIYSKIPADQLASINQLPGILTSSKKFMVRNAALIFMVSLATGLVIYGVKKSLS